MVTEKPIKQTKAWSCLLTNLLVFPGLGSIGMGEKKAGYGQIFLSVVGAGMVLIWAFGWIMDLLNSMIQQSTDRMGGQWDMFVECFERSQRSLLYLGFVLAVAAWIWALMTSLAVFKRIHE